MNPQSQKPGDPIFDQFGRIIGFVGGPSMTNSADLKGSIMNQVASDMSARQKSKSQKMTPMNYQKLLQQSPQVLGAQTSQQSQPQFNGIIGAGSAPITQGFGAYNPGVEKFSKGINYGTDFGLQVGTPVGLPPGKWKVVKTFNGASKGHVGDSTNQGYGNSVLVQNAETGEQLRFSHLSDVKVQQGQELNGGVVGLSGDTGNVTGPHLDLEYYDNKGKLADVMKSDYANKLYNGPTPATGSVLGANTQYEPPKSYTAPAVYQPKQFTPPPMPMPVTRAQPQQQNPQARQMLLASNGQPTAGGYYNNLQNVENQVGQMTHTNQPAPQRVPTPQAHQQNFFQNALNTGGKVINDFGNAVGNVVNTGIQDFNRGAQYLGNQVGNFFGGLFH